MDRKKFQREKYVYARISVFRRIEDSRGNSGKFVLFSLLFLRLRNFLPFRNPNAVLIANQPEITSPVLAAPMLTAQAMRNEITNRCSATPLTIRRYLRVVPNVCKVSVPLS